jgi:hypothetical protein
LSFISTFLTVTKFDCNQGKWWEWFNYWPITEVRTEYYRTSITIGRRLYIRGMVIMLTMLWQVMCDSMRIQSR